MTISDILDELNLENGANYKSDVLKKHSDNKLLKRVFRMALDDVAFNYFIRNIPDYTPSSYANATLEDALDFLEYELCSRKITGNEAHDGLQHMLNSLSSNDADVIARIIERNLKVGIQKKSANKVWKNLIVKPVYMRCGIFNEKTVATFNIRGAYCQLKADGTYREATVDNELVSFMSRSGQTYHYPLLTEILQQLPDGKYIGELTVMKDGELLERSKGNGLINSDNPPHGDIIFEVWDYVTLEEYVNAANKIRNTVPYKDRFERLADILNGIDNKVCLIESYIVNDLPEALRLTSSWMNRGFEGAILKDKNAVFRDGTNPQQLKLKLEIDADVRITGFTEGAGKFVNTFGSISFETDDGEVKGNVSSGISDADREDFNARRNDLIGMIISVKFNDLMKRVTNEFHSLSHPRFIELRNDKDETDTLSRIIENRDMAMMLKS